MKALHILSCLLLSLSCFVSFGQATQEIYGLNFSNGQLRLASLDTWSGNVQLISGSPTSPDQFHQGVSDIDPIGEKYYYVRAGKIYTVSLDSGEVISAPVLTNPNQAASPITNIAYNWLNDTIYGLNYKTNELRFAAVDPQNGQVTILSSTVLSPDLFSMGDADIDPANRRYFYIRNRNELVVVDINDGSALHKHQLALPSALTGSYFTNLVYNWYNDSLYCLIYTPQTTMTPLCSGELRLAAIDANSGNVTVLSSNPVSGDCFFQGVVDIDIYSWRFIYLRQKSNGDQEMVSVNLANGNLIEKKTINSPNQAAAPITNIAYNELYGAPQPMAGQIQITQHDPVIIGAMVTLDAYVGPDATYTWQDGSTGPYFHVTETGTYSVVVQRGGMMFQDEIVVESATSVDDLKLAGIRISVSPNPASDYVNILLESENPLQGVAIILNNRGQIVSQHRLRDREELSIQAGNLAAGLYYLRFQSPRGILNKSFMIR